MELNSSDKYRMNWIKIAKALSSSDFTQIPRIIDNDFTYLKYMHKIGKNEENYK